ncbi:MAG: hypothetical protein FKY71_08885 [Spiribacter salinus]|uniref:Uncharacterized protein n=1 Tax=Spiribacter salinus TaxID=1335746 RepID=A0A540VRI4_9GAMM|nr:MAG: hypothetical protein FKY71_08885 [Spiribacter salinus]
MAEEVTIVISVDDQGTPQIQQAQQSLDDLGESTAKTGESAKTMGKDSKQAGGDMKSMGGGGKLAAAGTAAAAAAAAAAVASIGALIAVSVKGVAAFKELDEAQRGLERQLRRTGASGEPLQEELQNIEDAVMNISTSTTVGRGELREMAGSFLQITGSASIAEDELSLIADMSKEMGVSGEAAARIMAQAHEGELRPRLAQTTALTREQIEEINGMEDATERQAAANELLGSTFGGAASDVSPMFIAISNVEEAIGDVLEAIGEVIVEMDIWEEIIPPVEQAMLFLQSAISDNADAIRNFVLDAVIWLVESAGRLFERMESVSMIFALVEATAVEVVAGLSMLMEGVRALANFAGAFRAAIVSGIMDTLSAVLDGAESLANLLGQDLPSGLGSARDALNQFGEDMDDEVARRMEEAGGNLDDLQRKALQHEPAWENVGARAEQFKDSLGSAGDFADDMQAKIEGMRDGMGETADEADRAGERIERGGGDGGEGRSDDSKDAEVEAERKVAEEIAQVRMAAFVADDEIQQIQLDAMADRLELRQQEMTETERALELRKIEAAEEEAITKIREDRQSADRAEEVAEIQLQILREQDEAEKVRLETQAQRLSLQDKGLEGAELELELTRLQMDEEQQLEELRQQASDRELERRQAQSDAINSQLRQMDDMSLGIGTLVADIRELQTQEQGSVEATETMVAAFQSLAGVGSQVASLVTDDREKAAKIEAAFNAAAAVGAFGLWASTGFTAAPYGLAFANHTVAAAQFGAIAGGVGGGSGAQTSASGGGAGAGSRPSQAGAMEAGDDDSMAPISVNLDFSGATLLEDSPAIQRDIRNAGESAAQSMLVARRVR